MPKSRNRKLTKPRPVGSLKRATAELIDQIGSFDRAADLSGVGRNTLFAYTDTAPENLKRYVRADVIRTLEARAEYPVVTDYLAHEAGYVLMPAHARNPRDWSVEIAELAKETSDIFATLTVALADGEIDDKEAGRAIAEIDEAIAAAMTLRARLTLQIDEADL